MDTKQTSERLSKVGKRYFHLIEFDENEELIREIRKHPIGLFFIYLTGGLIGLITVGTFLFLASSATVTDVLVDLGLSVRVSQLVLLITGAVLTLVILAATIINAILYENNVIFVTNEKIAQILYNTIFDRKISQLSIGDVQDVTVSQKGILARIFNYGTLVIETAGEQQNYTFTYIPDPYVHSKEIVGSHERNLTTYGN